MRSLLQKATRNGTTGTQRCSRRPLRLTTFLAPKLFWFYDFISHYLAKKLRYPTELSVGSDYAQLSKRPDLAFICGLAYVKHTRLGMPPIEPLVAPVLRDQRYNGKPVYFSDVIVRRDSPHRSFADLRGCSWTYNERYSQSGYGITRFHLVQCGETSGYFSRVVEAGYHERAIQLVSSGEVDASAIDSHVLALVMRDEPALAGRLRVIDTFGPSPIQPIVAGRHLSHGLKWEVRQALLELDNDPSMKAVLDRACIARFQPVSDSTYDAIRWMQAVTEAAQFLTVR